MSIENDDWYAGQDHCFQCQYWDGCEDNNAAYCLRYPPTVCSSQDEDDRISLVTVYPETGRTWWCGEFSERD